MRTLRQNAAAAALVLVGTSGALTAGIGPAPPAAAATSYTNVASVSQRSGESWSEACLRTMTYGFTGCVRYLPSGRLPSWDPEMQNLAAKAGTRPVNLQLTVKTHDRAGLADVISHLPAAWKSLFVYNIHQEPEDDVLDSAGQAAYRAAYTDAATVTRAYGVQLPWVEWQEWTVDPYNTKGWNLANFTPPAADFGGVLWSMFEYNERDGVDAQVPRIQAAMQRYAPGKPWGLMASAYTIEGTVTTAKQQAQAAWLRHAYTATNAAGSTTYAWFNFNWPGTGGAAGEARVEQNPYALDTLTSLKTASAAPPADTYMNVASVSQRTGESWSDACLRTMTYGFTGCVRYLPSGRLPSWDSQLQNLAAKAGTRRITLQLTAKTHDRAGLTDVVSHLPTAWKSRFIYNIHQEPEDDILDAAGQAAYRAAYTDAATVTRAYGVHLPYVEWQEWTVDPTNTKGWNLANFTPPAADFGGVLWSMFEYNERDRVDVQVSRIQAAMQRYAPGKSWKLMSTAYTIEGTVTTAKQQAQAAWLRHSYQATTTAGSTTYAWFNFNWPGTGGAAGEARVEQNPYALDTLTSLQAG